ncbi:restriction endonuclease subunit S [Endozoicomonas ascidiicola]|uniref:restriction endonuclease subunit S n=1 Tax=Endozoicomonas ascidiicola TaxID=1698521 RepID=UPI00082BF406|nr:restriction endonuclease subunit S [Endozoicomonas ascidiicola]
MKSDKWAIKTIGELISEGVILVHKDGNHGAKYPRANEFLDRGVPFLTAKLLDDSGNIDFKSAPKLSENKANTFSFGFIETGDVLLSHNATIGRVAVVPDIHERMLIGTSLTHFRLNQSKLLPKYLASYFSSTGFQNQLASVMSQTTRNQVPITSQRNLSVVIPPIEEQERISHFLNSFDQNIENNRQTNQTLEAIAQTLFKSWFVDFDPVKAKLSVLAAGGSAEEAERAAMCAISARDEASLNTLQTEQPEAYAELARTAALFPSAMQDSELGEIPEGWELSEIGKEVSILGGGTPSTKQPEFWDNGDICWTTPKDLSNATDKVILGTERKITKEGLNKISSGILPINTVLLSSRAPVGYLALTKVPLAINQGYIAMRCEQNLPPEYVLLWASSVMDEIKQRASGTTFAEISKKNFKPIKVIVPAKKLLDDFAQRASKIYDQIANQVSENSSLTRVRDTLLPKLLSGELTLSDTTPLKANLPESDMLNAGSVPAEVVL